MKAWNTIGAIGAVLAICGASMAQDKYGDVTFTFKYDGKAAEPAKVTPTKDVEFCGQFNIIEESLLVNAANNGIANVLVSIFVGRNDKPPVPAPSYAEALKQPVVLDNKGCSFMPHLGVAMTGQTVILKNSDSIGHNSQVEAFKNQAINPIIPAGQEIEVKFAAAESLPVSVRCNVHPWMRAWLVIKDHPYAAVSDADGKVTLKDVPVGKWSLQVWHEKSGYVQKVKVAGKPADWRRGIVEVNVEADKTTDIGEVLVPAAAFEK